MSSQELSKVADPATGLSPWDVAQVRRTWDMVKAGLPDIGYDLFIRFFTENPTYQQKFISFRNVPIPELRGNKRVLAHATSVLYAITSLVDNLHDTEMVVEMIEKIGANHDRRNITMDNFRNLGKTIVGLLTAKLGPEIMTPEVTCAWGKTYGVILKVVETQIKDK